MTQFRGLTEALAGFARTLTEGFDVEEVLDDLTGRLTGVLAADGAAVSLVRDGALRFVTADRESIAALERVQEEHRQGPCEEAVRSGRPILVSRLASHSTRWPRYSALAARVGVVAVAAIPMGNAECIGTLDLHRAREHAWTEHEVATARVFTDIATAYVLQASQHAREQRTIEQLQHALNSRVIIEQAKGVLAAERKISVDQAFCLLRKHANDRNVTLRAVADAVVNLGLRP
ncbi:MAG TPA: GAF and ANTAR domain-containing protein [Jatrophihabitans sp.]|jgi:hypothetical protein